MNDGSGVMIPYMTLMQTFLRQHAEAGVEAVASLTQYQHHFAQQLNARMNGVDLTIPDNQPFKAAAKELQEEFAEHMNKIHFSNPAALSALASQVSQFDKKLDALPQAYRKTKMRKTAYPDARKVSETAQQAVETEAEGDAGDAGAAEAGLSGLMGVSTVMRRRLLGVAVRGRHERALKNAARGA